ncbi:MAG: hypothetical protein A2527_01005 [Candidatus Lambdaproteobacteria bacterium RIFOXYD2_FULL_50_16]|uniref:Uncharacterized protein n=1 Tax=Candidatus Lambdaproteobacteria bacterium RIFOXYD2_FULL_50_16 TaxID=1817772 RepID=A0A1F6G9K1_9PROT|nr:MAG: hypothetical protein A2527_01005 [Candidatus Lambdaproteobacteria bacterium RIFOXYD2_FULL_50_16]
MPKGTKSPEANCHQGLHNKTLMIFLQKRMAGLTGLEPGLISCYNLILFAKKLFSAEAIIFL